MSLTGIRKKQPRSKRKYIGKANPVSGEITRSEEKSSLSEDTAAALEALKNQIAERDYYRFLPDPAIPPSNNPAERCARKTKRKFAQVMAFRSQEDLDYFCDGLSIVETMRSEGANVYNEAAKLFHQGRRRDETYGATTCRAVNIEPRKSGRWPDYLYCKMIW